MAKKIDSMLRKAIKELEDAIWNDYEPSYMELYALVMANILLKRREI